VYTIIILIMTLLSFLYFTLERDSREDECNLKEKCIFNGALLDMQVINII
jgi:hypothetical protein